MSLLFPRFNDFSPIFRFAEEIDRATRSGLLNASQQGTTRSFAPRFDIRETQDTYELHGELPGVDQSNINIEWADDNTLTISGHTEQTHESSSEPQAADELSSYQKPTVEEEGNGSSAPVESETTVTKTEQNQEVTKADENRPRYWVSERSYGSFNRSFQFPTRVDQENIKANLKSGILQVVVPKIKAQQPRKIQIE
jgi:HSP20 family protein